MILKNFHESFDAHKSNVFLMLLNALSKNILAHGLNLWRTLSTLMQWASTNFRILMLKHS